MTSEEMMELGRALRGDARVDSLVWLGAAVKKAKISANAHGDSSALNSNDNQRILDAIVASVPALIKVAFAAHEANVLAVLSTPPTKAEGKGQDEGEEK
jgi:hypothetical protein